MCRAARYKKFKNLNIIPIVHFNVKLSIVNLGFDEPRSQYQSRVQQEIEYGQILNAKYFVIHCGTKGKKNPIPREHFRNQLNHLISSTRIPILLENSASKNCYGSTLEELKELTKGLQIGGFVYDTMHHYGAGNDWQEIWKICEYPMVKLIHVNNIPQNVTFGSGEDRHESLDNGKMNDFNQLQRLDKVKILKTPNREKWINELKIIQTKIADFKIQNIQQHGFKVYTTPVKIGQATIEGAIDSGAEITCISDKAIQKLSSQGIPIIHIPNPPRITIKQAARKI